MLGEQEKKTLKIIKIFFAKYGRVPTIRELMKLCKTKSSSTIWWRLDRLNEGGYIKKDGKTYTVTGAKITFDDNDNV